MAEDDARTDLEHQFLDHAKTFEWDAVKTMLAIDPDLINAQPAGRWTALHQAAFEGNKDMAEFLVRKGSSLTAVTRARKTALEVAKGSAREWLQEAPTMEFPSTGVEALPEAAAEPAKAVAEPAKAAADKEERPKKKAKVKADPVYTLNINGAIDKEYEGSSFKDIAAAPTSALQGIAEKGRVVLRKLGIKTVRDLGTWKFYKISKAIAGLSALEEPGKREEGAFMNVNKAVDKKHETSSFQEMVKLPPSALQGLAEWVDIELASVHIKTIGQLGEWKFARWAEWIVDLAEFEAADFSS
uniref:Uncharacterized protein n=1 Tax=Alexandrium catenella TaxID=2925 RepID=A0A7S1SA98_ALECA